MKEPPSISLESVLRSYRPNKDNLKIAQDLKNELGDIFYLPYHPGIKNEAYIITDTEMVGKILQKKQSKFRKPNDRALQDFRMVMGNGLVASEGDIWLKQTRMIQPEFMREKMKNFVYDFDNVAKKHLDKWNKDNINLHESMKDLSLDMMANSLFGKDVLKHKEEIKNSINILRKGFKRRTEKSIKMPLWVPTNNNMELHEAKDKLREVARILILNRKNNPEKYDDIFSKLMKISDPVTEEKMSDTQLQDEVVSFIVAGHETTAAALTWTFYLLAKNKNIQKEASEEAKKYTVEEYGKEVVEKLDYNRRVFNETLRLYPVVPMFSRTAIEDTIINNYKIREGVTIIISPYLIHRDSKNWNNPNNFNPERFKNKYNEYSFIPFSKGGHSCTGQQMARLESLITLQNTLNNYEINIDKPKNKNVDINSGVNLIPDENIKIKLN